MTIEDSVTDDFVESFKDTTNFGGGFFHLILAGVDDPTMRPIGLNYDDERVKAILERARKAQGAG